MITGELNTDGTVISHISKKFRSNITVGVCSVLNHNTNSINLGLEISSGMKFTHDE